MIVLFTASAKGYVFIDVCVIGEHDVSKRSCSEAGPDFSHHRCEVGPEKQERISTFLPVSPKHKTPISMKKRESGE